MTASARKGERIREAQTVWGDLWASLLAVAPILERPFPEDPDGPSPWDRYIAPDAERMDTALDSLVAALAAAEQERAEIVSYWQERHQVRTDQLHAAEQDRDDVQTALAEANIPRAADVDEPLYSQAHRVRLLHERAEAAVARADRLEQALREVGKAWHVERLSVTDELLRQHRGTQHGALLLAARTLQDDAALASPAPDRALVSAADSGQGET